MRGAFRSLLSVLPAAALLAGAGCGRPSDGESNADAASPALADAAMSPAADLTGPTEPGADLAQTTPDLGAPGPADNVAVADAVADTATERANSRLIVLDRAGALHVVFYANGLYHAISANLGGTWSTPTAIDAAGRYPALALDGNGVLHLVYVQGTHDVVHRRYQGSSWSDAELIHHDPVTNLLRPSLAIDAVDGMHCVWQRAGDTGGTANSEIFYKKHSPASGWDADPLNLSNSVGASEYPTVVTDSHGTVFVFWKDSGDQISNDKMVLLKRYSPVTGWDTSASNVSGTSGNGSSATMDPSAVVDAADQVHLVWKDAQTGNTEIFYKRYADGTWDAQPTNLSHTDTASGRPILSVDAKGRVYVAWSEKTDGVYFDVVWATIANGSASSPHRVNQTTGVDALFPNAPAATGAYLSIIWTEVTSSGSRVRYQRIESAP